MSPCSERASNLVLMRPFSVLSTHILRPTALSTLAQQQVWGPGAQSSLPTLVSLLPPCSTKLLGSQSHECPWCPGPLGLNHPRSVWSPGSIPQCRPAFTWNNAFGLPNDLWPILTLWSPRLQSVPLSALLLNSSKLSSSRPSLPLCNSIMLTAPILLNWAKSWLEFKVLQKNPD